MEEKQLYKFVGNNIKEARTLRGYTQQELADLVNLTRSSITNIELGRQKLPIHVLFRIAAKLTIDPTSLLPKHSNNNDLIYLNDKTISLVDISFKEISWIKRIQNKQKGKEDDHK